MSVDGAMDEKKVETGGSDDEQALDVDRIVEDDDFCKEADSENIEEEDNVAVDKDRVENVA